MRRISLVLILSIIGFITANAQSPLAKGEKQLNAGIGFSGIGLPIYGGIEMGIQKDITVGIEGSYRSYNQDFPSGTFHSSIFGISGNGNYHFNSLLEMPSIWDFYAGLNLGFYVWSSPSGYPGNGASGLGFGAQVGGRYFIKHNLGLNLEFNGGNTITGAKFGVTYIF
jgi:outer membrane immunogenic protein